MSRGIVDDMVNEMGLTPAMADQLQQQQANGNYSSGMSGGGMSGGGMPGTPEEQMRLMDAAQRGQPMPMPQYEESTDESSEASTESDLDLEKAGLAGKPKSMLDNMMEYLRDPLIIIVLYIILSLTQVDKLIKQVLPAMVSGHTYYYLGTKGLLLGIAFLLSRLVFS